MSDELRALYRAAQAEQVEGVDGAAKAAFLRALMENAHSAKTGIP